MILQFLKLTIMLAINMHIDLSPSNWQIVNDTVMGGKSTSSVTKAIEGGLQFSGKVSLENNGGFCMVKSILPKPISKEATMCTFTVIGDGKTYQFRLKPSKNDRESYVMNFKTDKTEQSLSFKIADFKPYFRGRSLNLPPITKKEIEEIAFLVGNKKEESFSLTIKNVVFN